MGFRRHRDVQSTCGAFVSDAEAVIYTRVWYGDDPDYSLQNFAFEQRAAYSTLQSEHIDYKLQCDSRRVDIFLGAIKEPNDIPLQVQICLVRADDGPDGKMINFQSAVNFVFASGSRCCSRSGESCSWYQAQER